MFAPNTSIPPLTSLNIPPAKFSKQRLNNSSVHFRVPEKEKLENKKLFLSQKSLRLSALPQNWTNRREIDPLEISCAAWDLYLAQGENPQQVNLDRLIEIKRHR